MRILFVSSEVSPYSKMSELADTACALPPALAHRGHDVLVITPRYGSIKVSSFNLKRRRLRVNVPIKGNMVHGGVWEGRIADVIPVLFVDQPTYFDRRGLYGENNVDYLDNDQRFAFFSHSIFEICRLVGFTPDVIHSNDWQTGPVSPLLQFKYRDRLEFRATGTVFTIHDHIQQGLFAPDAMLTLGLDWTLFTPSTLEYLGKVSFIKAGAVFADKITIVSRTYAKEIKTSDSGSGLKNILTERSSDLRSIFNGVDCRKWNPSCDKYIAQNYSMHDLDGKKICKADLQKRVGLPSNERFPLIGCIAPLTYQKGVDMFLDVANEMLALDCQFVFVGQGDKTAEQTLTSLAKSYPHRLAYSRECKEDMNHRIKAGADIYLMPSRHEPCGQNQMHSLKYGTIPIVHTIGSLADTIDDVREFEDAGNGFSFSQPFPSQLLSTVRQACEVFQDKNRWHRIMNNAMSIDFSWDLPARQYETVYRNVIALRK